MEFDQLTRGEQFKVLRIRDYQYGVSYNLEYVKSWESLLERYQYAPLDIDRIRSVMHEAMQDVAYFKEQLRREMGGAENEEFLTESHYDSESPTDRFTGITCTTVV
jgi:hypothetical protein